MDQKPYVLPLGSLPASSRKLDVYKRQLIVYDWDGNLINAYRLDVPIVSFGVTNDDSVLYGTTLDEEDFVVRKYNLKNAE